MNNKDWKIRYVLEDDPGTTPAGAMQDSFWSDFKPSASGPDRTPSGGVQVDQQPVDNPATYTDCDLSGTAPSLYAHHAPFRAAVCGQSEYLTGVTVTGADIAAVVSGNKFTKGSGDWGTLAEGDIVEVSGMVTNGSLFVALVDAGVTSSNLPLVWPVLEAESVGPTVTVKHLGRLRIGSDFPTFTVEMWHAVRGKGKVYRKVAVKDWGWSFDIPNAPTETLSFTCGAQPAGISSQLANTTIAIPSNVAYVHNSNVDFGDQLHSSSGGGFRYNGTLYAPGTGSGEVRIKKVEHKLTRKVSTSGAAGAFGPQSVFTEDLLDLSLTIDVYRDSALCEAMLADRDNIQFEANIGFVMIDGAGKRYYNYYPALQYIKGSDTEGLKNAGEDMASFPMKAKKHPVLATMFQQTLLG